MDNELNEDLWITIGHVSAEKNGMTAIESTQVMNLPNGCLIKHYYLIIQSNIFNTTTQLRDNETMQFIPDINIELDNDEKIKYIEL
jgi:hypothetical protein